MRLSSSDLCLQRVTASSYIPFNFKTPYEARTAVCCVCSSYLHLVVVSLLVSGSSNFIMYVFECFIARFDPLGVLYLSVGGRRRNFQEKVGKRKGSGERGRRQDPWGGGGKREKAGSMRREEEEGLRRGKEVGREEGGKGGGEEFKTKLDMTRSYLHTGFTHSDIQFIILSSPAPEQVGQAVHLQTERKTKR